MQQSPSYGWALVVFARGAKTFERTMPFAVAGFLAYFTFNVGVHENHLFAAVLVALMASHFDVKLRRAAASMVAIFLLNSLAFYGLDGAGVLQYRVIGGLDFTVILAFLATCQMLTIFAAIVCPTLATRQIQVPSLRVRSHQEKSVQQTAHHSTES